MFRSLRKILRDLVCDRKGIVVYEKLGAVTAHCVGSYVVIYQAHRGTLNESVFLFYLAFACGNAVFSKALSLKYPTKSNNESESNVIQN